MLTAASVLTAAFLDVSDTNAGRQVKVRLHWLRKITGSGFQMLACIFLVYLHHSHHLKPRRRLIPSGYNVAVALLVSQNVFSFQLLRFNHPSRSITPLVL